MRKLTVAEFMSLDGVIQDPGGDGEFKHRGWTFDIDMDPAVYEYKWEELRDSEALLLGRTTYDGFAAAWPDRTDEVGFADKFNTMPKYVVSGTLTDPSWNNTTVLGADAATAVAELKETEGGPILLNGSAQLVWDLHKNGLVDEYRLLVWPVILGSGLRLFPDDAPDKQKLTLAETRTFANGIQLQTFQKA